MPPSPPGRGVGVSGVRCYKPAMSAAAERRDLDLRVVLPDEAATDALGGRLAPVLAAGDVVALWGGLGAGKTALARAIIRARAGRAVTVPSPTFTLMQSYALGDATLWHCDFFRLGVPEEAHELGLDEIFADAIALIEWPDRLGPLLPPDRLDVRLEFEGEGRAARLTGGPDWSRRLEGLFP